MTEVLALSGGKDSVCLALAMAELEPNPQRIYLHTPTGDELPPMKAHMERVQQVLGTWITVPPGPSLRELIDEQGCLPNWRMRWCTRMIKIEPAIEFMRKLADPVLLVGLRADETGREGLYDEEVTVRFPFQEWGWGLSDVQEFLGSRKIAIPERTDCARCYYQRLHEWWALWKEYPDVYESAVQDELKTGHTFRSPQRDTQPAALVELRQKFEAGYAPKKRKRRGEARGGCRICSM